MLSLFILSDVRFMMVRSRKNVVLLSVKRFVCMDEHLTT